MEKNQIENMKKDLIRQYEKAQQTFENEPEEEQEFLKTFSFYLYTEF